MFASPSKLARYSFAIVGVVIILAFLQLRGLTGWLTWLISSVPSPVLSPIKSVAMSIRHGARNVISIRSLYVENGQLKTRVQALERDLAVLQGVALENQMLRDSQGFAARSPVSKAACTVTSRDPEGITQTLLLSCGENQGVKVGYGVTANGYLVGKVVLVSARTATVRLLTAPTTAVDVRVVGGRTGLSQDKSGQIGGVLKGSFGSGLALEYIPETSDVQKGDLVLTAGVNALIPPDVLVGTVADAVKLPGALFYNMTVTSPIDLRDLRYVHVLRP